MSFTKLTQMKERLYQCFCDMHDLGLDKVELVRESSHPWTYLQFVLEDVDLNEEEKTLRITMREEANDPPRRTSEST